MKKEVRLYNVLFPIWLLWIFPQVWLVLLPGNLLIDCLVLTGALFVLKCRSKWAVVRQLWWKFWLLGFLADFVGVLWMMLALSIVSNAEAHSWWYDSLSYAMHNPFGHPAAFLWTLAAVALAGYCIYRFDKRAMKKCILLSKEEKLKIALAMAVITAPWLFFIPMY